MAPQPNKASAADYTSSSGDQDDEPATEFPSGEFADHHNPRKRRRTGRDAKESAALGIFGSESDDDAGGRRRRTNLRHKGVSFVSSGAKKPLSDDEDDDDDAEDDNDEEEEENGAWGDDAMAASSNDDRTADGNATITTPQAPTTARAGDGDGDGDDDDDQVGGVGLGFGRGGAAAPAGSQGLGWGQLNEPRAAAASSSAQPSSFAKAAYDGNKPLGTGFIPSSARDPALNLADDNDDELSAPRTAMPSTFQKSKNGQTKINPKSFGARMIAKMGYTGGGLGRVERQGRSEIIEANLRPQRAGLGAVKEKSEKERQEEKRQARLRGEVVVDSDEEVKKKRMARVKKLISGGSGPGSGASTPQRLKRPNMKYVTMDEARKAASGLDIPDAFMQILDKTGPSEKLLTSSSGLITPTRTGAPAELSEATESRKLARRAQSDFMAILEEWQSLQERKAFLELQLQHERQELEGLVGSLEVNQSVTAAYEAVSHPVVSGELDKKADLAFRLKRIISGLRDASQSLPESMLPAIRNELASLAVAAIYPTFKEFVAIWDPLEDPTGSGVVDALRSIRGILGLDQKAKKAGQKAKATPYEAMIYRFWLPVAADAVREWQVRDSDQLLAVVEAWNDLMPGFVRAQLLEQDVVRKLEEAVRAWEPRRNRKEGNQNQPHMWIFPWLKYLPAHHLDPGSSAGLVADVRRKFRQLIDVWDFKRGAIPGLKAWKNELRPDKSRDYWAPMVMNHLLPSMCRYITTHFVVDPKDQDTSMLEGLFEWLDVISPAMVAEAVVSTIMPKWHDVLYQWLLADNAKYDEIGAWFEWWQNQAIPAELRSLPSVEAEFDRGAAMIERALDLGDRVRAELKPPDKGSTPAPSSERSSSGRDNKTEHAARASPQSPPQLEPRQLAEEITFRHVIEDWCHDNDLQFIPERSRAHAEGPLYRITARGDGKGGVLAFFKGDVLVAEARNREPERIRRGNEGELSLLLDLAS